MAEFDYFTFAVLVGIIVGIGLLMFYVLKKLPNFVRKESPRKAEARLKDEAFNALNTLSSLVRMARQQAKDVESVTPMLREARSAYDTGDYEGAKRTATMGKEVLKARGLTLRKEIVKVEEMKEEEPEEEGVGEEEAEPEPAPAAPPRPSPVSAAPAAPPPVVGPTIANGGEDEALDEGAEGGEQKGEEEEFETPASVLRRQKPRNYMEAKFMILQVENFLTGEERAGRINKEARRDLEDAKRHFKENDFDMSLALASRAKRATGKTEDFVKVTEKEEAAAAGAPADAQAPSPSASAPAQRPPSAAARAAQAATTRLCGNCGAQVAAKDKFCRECGATAARQCPKCNETLEAKDKFCGSCGAKA